MPSDGMTDREPKTRVCSPSMCGHWFSAIFLQHKCGGHSTSHHSAEFSCPLVLGVNLSPAQSEGGGGEKDDDRIEIGDCLAGDGSGKCLVWNPSQYC